MSGEEASSALSSNALVLRTEIFSVLSKCHEKETKKKKKKKERTFLSCVRHEEFLLDIKLEYAFTSA